MIPANVFKLDVAFSGFDVVIICVLVRIAYKQERIVGVPYTAEGSGSVVATAETIQQPTMASFFIGLYLVVQHTLPSPQAQGA